MSDILTRIESIGTVYVPSNFENRKALEIHIQALKAQGHAITTDEAFESGNPKERSDLRVHHYKTCNACKKGVL